MYGIMLGIDPILFAVFFFLNSFRNQELSLAGPPAIELAVDISSGSRYCLVYYTYYLSTAPLPSNFQSAQCARTELKRTGTGNSFVPDARTYVSFVVVSACSSNGTDNGCTTLYFVVLSCTLLCYVVPRCTYCNIRVLLIISVVRVTTSGRVKGFSETAI